MVEACNIDKTNEATIIKNLCDDKEVDKAINFVQNCSIPASREWSRLYRHIVHAQHAHEHQQMEEDVEHRIDRLNREFEEKENQIREQYERKCEELYHQNVHLQMEMDKKKTKKGKKKSKKGKKKSKKNQKKPKKDEVTTVNNDFGEEDDIDNINNNNNSNNSSNSNNGSNNSNVSNKDKTKD